MSSSYSESVLGGGSIEPRHRLWLLVMAIAYLALHSVWRQIVFGEFSFALLRLLFMIVVVGVAMFAFDWRLLRLATLGGRTTRRRFLAALASGVVAIVLLRVSVDATFPQQPMKLTSANVIAEVVVPPLTEEPIFRAIVLGALLGALPRTRWLAVVIGAIAFVGVHEPLHLNRLVATFALGITLNAVYASCPSVPLCILLHALWNAIGFTRW